MQTFAPRRHRPLEPAVSRPAPSGPVPREHPLLRLQRMIGNQAVLRILQKAPAHVHIIDVDKDPYDVPDKPGLKLPSQPTLKENVLLNDEDAQRTEQIPYSQLLDSPDYVDNGVVSVGAEIDDFWTASIKNLQFQYVDMHLETVAPSDIDLRDDARADKFVRRKGVVYPLRDDGTVSYNHVNTPTIIRFAELKFDQQAQVRRERLMFAQTVFQFSMAVASLAAAVNPETAGAGIREGGGLPEGGIGEGGEPIGEGGLPEGGGESGSIPESTGGKAERMGRIIGWGEGKTAEAVAQTEGITQKLTPKAVEDMIQRGLTKEFVTDQLAKYTAAIARGGSKLKNVNLLPRKALMTRILELWPK